jgi:hypothetical protein
MARRFKMGLESLFSNQGKARYLWESEELTGWPDELISSRRPCRVFLVWVVMSGLGSYII